MPKSHVIIVGAGLCGTMLAIRLAQRGHEVSLFEKRSDMRRTEVDAGRSINLALSDRGLRALRLIGLEEQIRGEVIPMRGRMIHPVDGKGWLSPYSGRPHEFINSVSRSGLNIALLNAAEKEEGISIHFNHQCTGVDLEKGTVSFVLDDGFQKTATADMVFGADGAGSLVRRSFLARGSELRFDYAQDFLDHGYKELSIPSSPDAGWRIEKHALHIWPRQDFMLIALPNLDGSFTVTLFLPFDGSPGFDQLKTAAEVGAFFTQHFPDAASEMPGLVDDFFSNPTGILGTIRCLPWHAFGKTMLIGDAAHAVVPFYGQGMNCALEDVVVLDQILDLHEGDWLAVSQMYQEVRKEDTDAIADMALENYFEMRDHVDNPDFIVKRKLEMLLEMRYPEYSSKYNLVTFNENIPYSKAMALGHAQDQFLLDFATVHPDADKVDIAALMATITAKTAIQGTTTDIGGPENTVNCDKTENMTGDTKNAIRRPFHLQKWIDDHKEELKPPVGNRNLYRDAGDYIVMVVAGPNARKDYHFNETEELYYQVEGDITVRIQEDGKPVDIDIKEGEMFLLPAKVPHSPMRPDNTVGLVIELKRSADEKDGLMWFCDNCNNKLHDTYFALTNIEKDFLPRFREYYGSEALRTCGNCGEVMAADQRFVD